MKKGILLLIISMLFVSLAWARGPINEIDPMEMNQAKIDAREHGRTFQVNSRDEDITITVTVDSWADEASWNLWNDTAAAYYWATDWTFASSGEVQIQTVNLADGMYSVDCWDTYGDGGIAGVVEDASATVLVEWGAGDYTSFGEFWFEVGAIPVEFTVIPAAIDETLAPDATTDVPVTITNTGGIEFDYTTSASFPIFSFDAQTAHGETGNLGAEFDGTYYWTTARGLVAAEHQIFKWDAAGNLLAAYDQGTTSSWGMRDLAWDPAVGLLYAGDDNGFYQIDPATGAVTTLFTGQTFGTIRALALLPDGTFWTKSFGGDIAIFDIAGNLINTYPAAESAYGAAYDDVNDCVWVFEGTTPNNPPTTFSQWDVTTATFTGVTIAVPLLDGLTAQIIGGAFYYDGKIGGMLQGTDVDTVFEMNLVNDWFAITANGTGTVAIGAAVDVTVNLDAAGLVDGDVKEATLGITGVAGFSTQETDVPVTLNVEAGGTVYPLPFAEGFEGGVMPNDWTQEYVSGTEDWEYTYGVNSTHPADPHSGDFNAYFNGSTGNITKLVTPQIDMGTATDVELTFWHAQQVWAGDQDVLRIYYKNSAAGAWTLLAEYLGDIPSWTEEIITLPDLSNDYYIAFEGEDGYGYGIGVDDISIEEGGITNDFCVDAEVVGEVTDYLFDTTTATTSGFDTHNINQDLWYVYTATGDGTITVDICESLFDTKLAVYGECDVATELGYNDDSYYCINTATSAIEDIPVVNGEDYYIQVGGYSSYFGEGYLTIVLTSSFVPEPPTNLFVTEEAYATWEAPGGGAGEWISWDDGANAGSVGLTSGGDWAIASRWDPAAIAPYDGMYLTSVNFFPKSDITGYEIKVWTGADATNLVLAQAVPTFNVDEWNEIVLDTPILIDAADEFWFGVQILGQPVGEYPAARDAGPAVAWYGDMITMDGVTWAPLSGYGLDYNWNIQGYVEAVDGETFVMNHQKVMPSQERTAAPIIDVEMKNLSSRLFTNVSNPISKHAYENLQQNRDLLGYNVYIDYVFDVFTTELFHQYLGLVDGTTYLAQVTAVYDEGESDPIDYTFTYVEDTSVTVQIDPLSVSYWTGTTDGATLTDDSEVRGWDTEDGWMMFDTSAIPTGATVTNIEFNGYVNATNWPYWAINDIVADPLTATPADLYADIQDGEYNYFAESGAFAPGWKIADLGGTSLVDMEAALAQGWFAIGINSTDNSTAYYINFDGWNEANPPFLMVTYEEGGTPEAPAVFFSEYIEGSSNNKALEIYNGTGDVINLDDFRINQSVNGGGWEYQHIFPAGATVADSDVWVILNDGTDPILFDPADADEILAYPSVVHHNGDDARGLEYSEDGGVTWILIDVIGVPTEDPGDGWDVAGVTAATKNHTLVRKEEIVMGNTDWAASAGTTPEDSEWIVYDEDTFEYLGEHPSGTTLNPPTNLFVTEEGYATWEPPSSGAGEWISWDDGANAGAVGLTSGGDWAIASRWDPAAIAPYDGMYLTSVNFFPKSASTGYEIKVWTGADATNLVLAQAVPTFNVDEWNEIVLDTPILIDAADEFWFGVQILGQPVGEYPAARDAGPAVAWYGDMITMDGVTWAPLSGYGLDYNWNIQGYVEAVDGETFVMNHKRVMPNQERTAKPIIDLEMKKLSSRLFTNVSNPISKHAYENLQQNRDLLGYNVYLDDMTTPITYTTDPECLLTDYATLENGTEYIAGVSAVYDEGESDLIYYTFTYVEGVITNDFCEDAEVVGEVTDYLFDTTDATTSGFDTHSINQDLWYVYTATGDGTITVDVCESLFDTKLAVYGECDVATELGYNDDSSYCIDYATSAIEDIPVVNGEDYYIQVGGFGSYYGEGYLTIVLTSTFVPNPPTNVAVDPEIALLTWDPPVGAEIYFDDFESYTLGGYLAEQSDEWTTWSGAVGGPEDAFIVDTQAFSPTQSVLVEGASTDLVHLYGDLTTGMYNLGIYMYIEPGYGGYFNILHEFTGDRSRDDRHEWALETYFASDGTGYINAGGAEAATFTYPTGTWFECSAIINLDDDLAEYYIDGVYVHDWQWSLTALGNPGLCQIGAMDIFAAAPTGDSPMFYFDDVAHLELVDPTGYNVYLTNMVTPVANLGSDITEYEFEGLTPLQEYTVGVSADYDGEESEIIQVTFIYDPQLDFYPPTNPAAEVVDYNDVLLTWEAPSGAAEWMRWDSGENADAIGLTSGGTFYVASHWDPADLTVYDGATISKIEYFPNDVGDYIMYVWTGPNAGTLVTTEVVTTPTIGEFQEIILSTPVTIDASTELWFGYEVTHAAGAYPAGCDAGPAIAGYGDMISFDATAWDPMSSLGLDYNWNLGAFVEGADGEVVVLRKPHKTIGSVEKAVSRNSVINHNLFSCVQTSHVRETRSLTGYNIYKDGGIYDSVDDATILEYIDTAQDAGTYEYTVTAVYTSPDGESDPTAPVTATVVLNPPTNAVAESLPPNIMIEWDAPARGIASYTVLRDGVVVGEDIIPTMYIDINVPTGEYIYNVIAVYDGGWESELSNDAPVPHVDGDDILKPTETALTGNYPNPFNPTTTISFSLKEAGNVSINIYNMRGQLVKTLVNGELDNAYHKIVWDGKDNSGKNISSGVYFYKMKTQDYNSTKKMILMK